MGEVTYLCTYMNIYKISGKKGIDDLKSLYAFSGNSQGDETRTNSIEDYVAAKGWLSFDFKCEMTPEAIQEEINKRKAYNEKYLKELHRTGEYGKEYFISISTEPNPQLDAPLMKEMGYPLTSYSLLILDVSDGK